MAVKRGDEVTAPVSREVRDSNQPQFMHKAFSPKIPVEKGVEHAVESYAGRGIRPPRDREVGGSERFRGHPRQSNRQQRQQKRNDSPFAGVCAVAVHTSPARPPTAEQAFQPAGMRPPPSIAAGKRPAEELALKVNWLPEDGPANILNVKQLLVVALLLISILLLFAAELTLFITGA